MTDPRSPRSLLQRQITMGRTMTPLAGAGRSSIVKPEPRPIPDLPFAPPGGDAVAIFSGTGLWADLPTYSSPDPARNSGVIYEITFGCNVAASDDTVIEVWRGGTSLGTWTLPAGEGATADDADGYTAAFDGGAVAKGNQLVIGHVSGGTGLEDPTIKIAAFSDTGTRGSPGVDGTDGADGDMTSVVAGDGIDVDSSDPANPVVYRKAVGAAVYRTSAFGITGGAGPVPVPFPNEDYDPDGLHSTSSNTSRVNIPVTGRYQLAGAAETSAAGATPDTGVAGIYFTKNGGTQVNPAGSGWVADDPYGVGAYLRTSVPVVLAAGDYVELYAYSDASLDINKAELSVELIGV